MGCEGTEKFSPKLSERRLDRRPRHWDRSILKHHICRFMSKEFCWECTWKILETPPLRHYLDSIFMQEGKLYHVTMTVQKMNKKPYWYFWHFSGSDPRSLLTEFVLCRSSGDQFRQAVWTKTCAFMHLWTEDKSYTKTMSWILWMYWLLYMALNSGPHFHMFDCFAGYNKFKLREIHQVSRRDSYGVHSTLGIIATVAAGSTT